MAAAAAVGPENSSTFKIFGIKFAPLRIPLKRRLETLAVIYIATQFFFAMINHLALIYILLYTEFYPVSLLYYAWLYYDKDTPARGGRLKKWTRDLPWWKYYANYFPISLEATAQLDPDQNYIFGYHPHGIMSYGAFGNFCTNGTGFRETFPGITTYLVTLKVNFWTPIHRDLGLWRGMVDCSKESINWLLQRCGRGVAVVIVLGGASESLDAVPNTMKLTLKSRKGFIRLALQNGASIVPVISFGENELFTQTSPGQDSWTRKIQNQMKRLLTFTTPIFHGRGIFQYTMGFLPYRQPIHTIVGRPIPLAKDESPSVELVDSIHQQYVQSLTELFDAHKAKYAADPKLELEIK